ncbi:MAG: hypothetical protein V3V09_01045 [Arenicellales bacterium]
MSGGGAGTIDYVLATGLRCNDRVVSLTAAASPVEVFYHLGMNRVHYVPQHGFLYFVNSAHFPVREIIHQVFKGAQCTPDIEQLYLDEHGYYKAAQRLTLENKPDETLAMAVLVALRMKDIKISMALAPSIEPKHSTQAPK